MAVFSHCAVGCSLKIFIYVSFGHVGSSAAGAFLAAARMGCFLVVVRGLLISVAFCCGAQVLGHPGFSSCTWAQQLWHMGLASLRRMGPSSMEQIVVLSPAVVGGFYTTEPPGKPPDAHFN